MKVIAANFKCNLTRNGTLAYCNELHTFLQKMSTDIEVALFPNQSSLTHNTFNTFSIGVQNAHCVQNGGFTGEIGVEQLEEFGIDSIIIGHSERRNLFNEDKTTIAKKFEFFASKNFRIFFCIGEDLAVRKNGNVNEFLRTLCEGIDLGYKNLVVAYEPIWAIGTGVSASIEEIEHTHKGLREFISAPLLYGGSVNETNAKAIMSLGNVDGVLVGSASLDIAKFKQIINATL